MTNKIETSRSYSKKTGHQLESDLIDTFGSYYRIKYGKIDYNVFRSATQEEDLEFGTDAFVCGLPVDFTYDFYGKKNMVRTSTTVDLLGIGKIRFGVRTANGRRKFDSPVLVIGIDTPLNVRTYMANIIDAIRKNIEHIVNTGSDVYWQTCDTMKLV